MNKSLVITIVVVVAAALLGLAFYKYFPMIQTPVNNTPAAENTIIIQNYTFTPEKLTVKVGDTVTWTNNDGTQHHVKSDVLDSGIMNSGDAYKFTFTQPGTYKYNCSIHTYMNGQIIVQ